jgi:phosphoribosyl 1,2-cyclic phosphodiesterase
MEKLRFQSFASGSSGNCYFLGYKSVGILIDAGIGIKTIRKCLRNIGLDFENILGVFVTHDHADHVKSVGILGEKYNIPIYSTSLVHSGIAKSYCVTEKLYQSKRFIEKNEVFTLDKFKITAFQVSHDATDNVGFMVEYNDKKFVFATDLGYVCESAATHLKQANYMVFESNYDEQMLNEGLYPPHLKIRIKADTGHLSNSQCAQFLAENYSSKLKNVFLCHLSRENNMPQIAYETVKEYLQQKDIHVGTHLEVVPLNRFTPSELYLF